MHHRPRAEQIAGLLHDASHTVFSHLTDMLFLKGFDRGNYQDNIHESFLKRHQIDLILSKYGFNVQDILPDNPNFKALEQELPTLCADRIEYNLQAGLLTGWLSLQDIQHIHDTLHFDGQDWYFDEAALAYKFAQISAHQTLNNWSSPDNAVISK